MKRNLCKVKWIKVYCVIYGKDLSGDNVFNFEWWCNCLVRYSRELIYKIMVVFKIVEGIRSKREKRYYDGCMKGFIDERRWNDRKEL